MRCDYDYIDFFVTTLKLESVILLIVYLQYVLVFF